MKNTLICIAALALLAACNESPEPTSAPAVDLAAGKKIAEQTCAACHGMDGKGKTKEIPNLAAQPAQYLIDALHAYRDGRRHHAALQDMATGMSEADIANIAGYYASLPPVSTDLRPITDKAAANSYEEGAKFAAVCVKCHGKNGNSTTPGVPSLAGQQPVYLIVSTQEYKNGSRGHVEKKAMLKGLEDIDIEKMAMYFAAQTPMTRQPPPFGDPEAGEPLTAECGGCHGSHGISHDPMVPSLAGQEPNYLVAAIKAYRNGERVHDQMVTNKSDDEIQDIAAYYSIQTPQAAVNPQSTVQELAAKCDRCHGPAVGERTLVVPSLRGQNRDYLIRVMKEYRDADRGSSMMHKMSAGYSDEMIEEIADYYAKQPSN